jgi:hypothetical protein
MKTYCPYCDPKHFVIYGFCPNCKRKCECPLFDPWGSMSLLDYKNYEKKWNSKRPDLVIDSMRKTERTTEGPK